MACVMKQYTSRQKHPARDEQKEKGQKGLFIVEMGVHPDIQSHMPLPLALGIIPIRPPCPGPAPPQTPCAASRLLMARCGRASPSRRALGPPSTATLSSRVCPATTPTASTSTKLVGWRSGPSGQVGSAGGRAAQAGGCFPWLFCVRASNGGRGISGSAWRAGSDSWGGLAGVLLCSALRWM